MCHFAGFETKQIMASDSSPCTQGCCQGTIEGRGYTLACVLAYRHEHKRPENGLCRSVGADFWFHIYLRLATRRDRPIRVLPVDKSFGSGTPPNRPFLGGSRTAPPTTQPPRGALPGLGSGFDSQKDPNGPSGGPSEVGVFLKYRY